MNQTLTRDTYSKTHKENAGKFEITGVHKKAIGLVQKQIGGKKILDIGCGNGELIFLAKKQGAEVYGMDFDPQNIESARMQTNEKNNITEGNATELPYDDNKFDFVFALGVLGYLSKEDLKKSAQEIFRVLQKGGTLVVRTATIKNIFGKIILKVFKNNYVSNTNFYSLRTHLGIFRDSGFEILLTESSIDDERKKTLLKKIVFYLLKPVFASSWIILKK